MRVWVNGTFDVVHIGHIRLLEHASAFGKVMVGIDTDERVKLKKGEGRPFNNLKDRMDFIKSIKFVDSVTSFGSDEELEQKIIEYEPDIMVIGKDYEYKRIIGQEYVEKIIFFDRVDDKSTTKILNYENSRSRGELH